MKNGLSIIDLNKSLENDFGAELNEFENFINNLKKNIVLSKRSLESQKLEAKAILEKLKNRKLLTTISVCLSLVSFAVSSLSAIFGDLLPEIKVILYFLVLITLLVIYIAFRQNTIDFKTLTYCELKLSCIELIEKENEANKLDSIPEEELSTTAN